MSKTKQHDSCPNHVCHFYASHRHKALSVPPISFIISLSTVSSPAAHLEHKTGPVSSLLTQALDLIAGLSIISSQVFSVHPGMTVGFVAERSLVTRLGSASRFD